MPVRHLFVGWSSLHVILIQSLLFIMTLGSDGLAHSFPDYLHPDLRQRPIRSSGILYS